MATAFDLLTQNSRGRAARNGYHAYHPTRTLADNLRVFEALVWRDYMRRDCLALADQIRSGINSWDAWEVSTAVWQHMTAYPYIAPPAGEELYVDFPGFMQRRGGDCDNKTLVQCCLLLASGVRCRAVVIELPKANGSPSGEGHMFCESYIPGRGWVAFDASKTHPSPGSTGHETAGFRRQVVDFSGNRPQEAVIMSRLSTAGYISPGQMQANIITGMLKTGMMRTGLIGSEICGPEPATDAPTYPSWAACQAQAAQEAESAFADTQKEPGFWGSLFGRGEKVLGEGLLGGFNRYLAKIGLAPQPTGGAGDVLFPLAVIAGVGTIAYLALRK